MIYYGLRYRWLLRPRNSYYKRMPTELIASPLTCSVRLGCTLSLDNSIPHTLIPYFSSFIQINKLMLRFLAAHSEKLTTSRVSPAAEHKHSKTFLHADFLRSYAPVTLSSRSCTNSKWRFWLHHLFSLLGVSWSTRRPTLLS